MHTRCVFYTFEVFKPWHSIILRQNKFPIYVVPSINKCRYVFRNTEKIQNFKSNYHKPTLKHIRGKLDDLLRNLVVYTTEIIK